MVNQSSTKIQRMGVRDIPRVCTYRFSRIFVDLDVRRNFLWSTLVVVAVVFWFGNRLQAMDGTYPVNSFQEARLKLENLLENVDSDPSSILFLSLYLELIDDACLEVCFEVHRKLKLGLLCMNCESVYSDIICKPGCDIFGQTATDIQNTSETFECVHCKRPVAASRYAPHLEKCMGLGRSSSRIANKRLLSVEKARDDIGEVSDPEDQDYNPIDKEKVVVGRKDKTVVTKKSSKPHKGVKIVSEPDKHRVDQLDLDQIQQLLLTTCGVISSTTGNMCTKTINCPQHTDEMRKNIRLQLLGKPVDINEIRAKLPKSKKNKKSKSHKPKKRKEAHRDETGQEFIDIESLDEVSPPLLNTPEDELQFSEALQIDQALPDLEDFVDVL